LSLAALVHDALEVLAHGDHALGLAAVHNRLLERREAVAAHDDADDLVERVGRRLHRPSFDGAVRGWSTAAP
jgi:hypothetical protein